MRIESGLLLRIVAQRLASIHTLARKEWMSDGCREKDVTSLNFDFGEFDVRGFPSLRQNKNAIRMGQPTSANADHCRPSTIEITRHLYASLGTPQSPSTSL